jgi:hypothetical protein
MSESTAPNPQDFSLCRHPYRVLFPLGWFLAWWAAAPWVLFGLEVSIAYPYQTHSLIFIQGVLTTFAAGFLFTMLPRRLGAPAPRIWQMLVVIIIPLWHAYFVWQQNIGLGHLVWVIEGLVLLEFSASRILGKKGTRSGPAAFVWVPIGFLCGCLGSASEAIRELWTAEYSWEWYRFSRVLLTQGMFLCLAMGIGAMFFPLTARKEASVDATMTENPRQRRLGHLLGAAGMLTGFWLDATALRPMGGYLAAFSVAAVLLLSGRIYRLPTVGGTQRRLIWISAWCLPLGLLLASRMPERPQIGFHVLFLGGLLLLTLSVALHVGLAHTQGQELVHRPLPSVRIFGGLLLLALCGRIFAEYAGGDRFDYLAVAAGCVLAALVAWGALLMPRFVRSWRGMTW